MKINKEEIMLKNNLACPGCSASLAMRLALKALGKKTVVVIPACCWTVINGTTGFNHAGVPVFHTAFETTAAVASGIKVALRRGGETGVTVMGWAGDGGTFDIGLQALSGAAERNEDIIHVCYDNEAYMNTGIQRSSATPIGAETTTTPPPHLKSRPKKDIMTIMEAHNIPYIASATVGFPIDLTKKFEKAKKTKGFRFILIFSPCPPGHKFPENKTITISKLAVETGIFPLYEIDNGRYKLSRKPSKFLQLEEYLQLQGRFKNTTKEQIEQIKDNIRNMWKRLNLRFQDEAITKMLTRD